MHGSTPTHWNTLYISTSLDRLSWFEPNPGPSLQLIDRCGLASDAPILDAGSGTTTLLAALLDKGFRRLLALDFSPVALEKAQSALDPEMASRIEWIAADLTQPFEGHSLPKMALWHDRAVFHFFIDEADRLAYRDNLLRMLQPNGYLILAAFAVGGAMQCSGLPVRNYDRDSLELFFAGHFNMLESMEYTHQTPSGEARVYIYTLFHRLHP
jgi:EEF1A lysine methyltransferase 2